jgi:hypothetical protein
VFLILLNFSYRPIQITKRSEQKRLVKIRSGGVGWDIGLGARGDQEIKDAVFLGIKGSRVVVVLVMLVRTKIEGLRTTSISSPVVQSYF